MKRSGTPWRDFEPEDGVWSDAYHAALAEYLRAPTEDRRLALLALARARKPLPEDAPKVDGLLKEADDLVRGDEGAWVSYLVAVYKHPGLRKYGAALRARSPFKDSLVFFVRIGPAGAVVDGDIAVAKRVLLGMVRGPEKPRGIGGRLAKFTGFGVVEQLIAYVASLRHACIRHRTVGDTEEFFIAVPR